MPGSTSNAVLTPVSPQGAVTVSLLCPGPSRPSLLWGGAPLSVDAVSAVDADRWGGRPLGPRLPSAPAPESHWADALCISWAAFARSQGPF